MRLPSFPGAAPPETTSAAALSRAAMMPLALQITPARWPLVVVCVAMVATGAGLYGAAANAPVGNRVALEVLPACPTDACALAASAAQAELSRQLRALRLEVGGPAIPRPAVRATVRVDVAPDREVAFAYRTGLTLDVSVVDDDAGGPAAVSVVGFGPTLDRAAARGGVVAAWAGAGLLAARVAPQHGRETELRRVTDGRGALRVYARARGELVYGRQERLDAVAEARAAAGGPATSLGSAGEHVRLVTPINGNAALVAVEDRAALLLPTARRHATIVAGLQHLEVRDGRSARRLWSAYAFPGRGAMSVDGHAGLLALDGDDHAAACTVDLGTGAHRCHPLGESLDGDVLAVSPGGTRLLVHAAACLSHCERDLVLVEMDTGRQHRAPAGDARRVRLADDGRVAWVSGDDPPRTFAWVPGSGAPRAAEVTVAAEPRVTTRPGSGVQRTEVVRLTGARGPEVILAGPGTAWYAAADPAGEAVFVEVDQPDPDAHVEWSQVLRVATPGR